MRNKVSFISIVLAVILILAGCGAKSSVQSSSVTPATSSTASSSPSVKPSDKPLTKIVQYLGWAAGEGHGGQYAALSKGFYKDAGLDMTIEQGGPQISNTQIVGSGKAQFGMAKSDVILAARDQGIPLVGLVGIYQKSVQGYMYHKGQNIKSFSDMSGHTIYVPPGHVSYQFVKSKFNLQNMKEIAYNFPLFTNDKTAFSHAFLVNEPITLKEQGIEVDFLLTADTGFNPYDNVLFTTEQYIKDHPDIVKAYVEASVKGWNYYRTNFAEINENMFKVSPAKTVNGLNEAAKVQDPFIFGEDAAKNGFGYMTLERWSKLQDQLLEMKVLKNKEDVSKAFTTQFLPKP
jgi:NitT/TauT family transport system substrate-binding protein